MKKILITRKLLKLNEERVVKIWKTKLNRNDEIYSQSKLVELSEDCDGILSSILDPIDEKTIKQLSNKVKINPIKKKPDAASNEPFLFTK